MKQTIPNSIVRAGFAVFLSAVLALGMLGAAVALPRAAYAETNDIEAEADAAQQEVERTAAAYDEAVAKVQELDALIAENEQRIEELEAELPEQQKRGADAMCALYKLQEQSFTLIDMILNAGDLTTFLNTMEYITQLHDRNTSELELLDSMQTELQENKESLETAKADADAAVDEASDALKEAQAAREEAQRKAQEKAEREAAEAAAALAAAEKAAQEAAEKEAAEREESQDAGDGSSSQGSSGGSGAALGSPSADGADWSSDKQTFVSQWAGRIDAYLAGSPLAGQGATFAAAAWDYGVDPRWSPAISNTESSKGLHCFKPHNAWGWGSSSWGSWEEAINAHVRGLARGYGYTISVEAAKKYCPPNWEHWYSATSAQMNMI